MGESVSKFVGSLALLGLFAALPSTSISAPLPSKVWVASWGMDNSSCGSVTSPCATLQRAHDNVAPRGDIRVLTPGDFGGKRSPRLSITKSVSITYDESGEAGIFGVLDGPAIYIAAGADDVVSLQGLVIDGQSFGSEGIHVRRASAVHIRNCVIRNFEGLGGGIGISLMPVVNSRVFISDSIIFNNGSSVTTGAITIRPSGSSASANVFLDRVLLEKNIVGLKVDSNTGKGVHVIARDSVVSGNAADGILANSASGKAPAIIILERTASVNNGRNGILADGPRTTALLRDSVVTGNDAAISTMNGGQLISHWQKPGQQQYRPVRRLERSADAARRTALLQVDGDLESTSRAEVDGGLESTGGVDMRILHSEKGAAVDELGTSPNQVRLARAKGEHGKIGHRSRFARVVKVRARPQLKLSQSARTQWRVGFSRLRN
jgi:Right handed beta helix region